MRQLVYTMFITNNCTLFHLWWKENLVKHQKVSKYYEMIVESTFIEMIFPNKWSYIRDSIYNHSRMKHLKFNKYMKNIFDKIKWQKKELFKLETWTWICLVRLWDFMGNNDLSLLQFRPSGNKSKNCSKHFRNSKKMKTILTQIFKNS